MRIIKLQGAHSLSLPREATGALTEGDSTAGANRWWSSVSSNTSKAVCTLICASLLTACGGGGGGGGDQFVGAALVNIDAVPRETDPGKRVQVTVRINEVHPDGVFVKIRFPDGFSYAPGTGRFSVQETKRSIDPQFNLAGTKEGVVYLVFNLARSLFGEDNEGMLVLELNADSGVQSGKIEIDADVNDPTVADPAEFSVENPEFDGQDDVEIKVRG